MSGSTTNNAQSLGIVTVNWGGMKFQPDAKSSSYSQGGYVSKTVVAGNAIYSARELVAPMVKFSFPLTAGMSISAIMALNGQQLIFNCDSGQKFVINGAFHTKDVVVKGGTGPNCSIEASGQPAAEVIS